MATDDDKQDRRDSPLSPDQRRSLQQRSDLRGLARLFGHLLAIGGTGWLYAATLRGGGGHWLLVVPAALLFGFTLVTMFAAMHESIHRTAFGSTWLNDGVGWFAGLLSFYNSTFYRYYHGWHHRFTQIPGRDPELEDPKPTDLASYVLELSALPWWRGKLRTHIAIARGQVEGYGFLNDKTRPAVVRSVRLQLLVYGAAIALSLVLRRPLFLLFWLLPVAAAQPLLRAILLAEHMGCSNSDDPQSNTRTTYTILPIRFLMWEMPFHAEHHWYPALPFHALSTAHQTIEPRLTHVARSGYLGFHAELVARFVRRTPPAPAS